MSILIFIIILLVLVLVHEFGHFFTAKRFGIRVDEFGFGFPPKLFGFKKGETEYSLNLLPLGGFVKIFGENFNEADFVEVGFLEKDSTSKGEYSRSFASKAKWKQALVLFAGVFANFLLAWLLFSFGFMSGLPTSVGNEVAGYKLQDVNLVVISVVPQSPAENAGLQVGDKIVFLTGNDNSVTDINPSTLKSFILSHGNKEINIGYARGKNKEVDIVKITPVASATDGKPEIGISMDQIGTAKLPFFTALWEGMKLNWSITKGTAVGFYTLIADNISGKGSFTSVSGPVGIVSIVGDAYEFGFVYLLSFTALISINLAIINLLPFPALDGGRLFFLLIEKIKGSRINPKVANTANMVGFGLLIFLMLVITYHDVIKLL
ncbi:TPA: RIP metalloprotease RseP [Candidatus Nomurabacteria bacterium]|uniref:Zinc metalloprotease n=2 Tax=Candidatus Nomuraibacteriota TaxID=1752729 RepID=A0A1F6YM16_9BACT|nr:MAG: Membrane-associated zinc metalloprotease [Parcubacteria group bacterium GW2011_GWC1_42_21]KKS58340.1 MAG: Membrane-associated zinc metalloprotease [Candidatus Nomurabacteria bacterium GW2011_GWF1_42_40]KKT00682.1 MAG: Membrane-associated zinc metalloprotease [Candidatus Nomurabacteria bacterium GW2011_GWA1_43_17]KKT07880.1 MAG: Membrane-associated zinc metalloprotease [Candidatus Nomurabacteria bacterium GW2011_GWB1_43_19]KKT11841.1 MAG: Membrane-associated zinc metalloprotease [Candida